MNHPLRFPVLALALLAGASAGAQAPAAPPKQAAFLTIYRETIKTGHDAAHAKVEAGWPAAFEKAKSPGYYLALASLTGISEVWFSEVWESYAAVGKYRDALAANAAHTAEIDRLALADAAHVDGVRVIEAIGRPDLGHGSPDVTGHRFWEVTTMRIRPGTESQFADAAKAYKALATRAMPHASWRIWQVSAGMVGPTFLIFSSVVSNADIDVGFAEGMAADSKMTAEERAILDKFSRESLISAETQRFRLDPQMSYVPAETKALDPKFWMKK